MSLLTDYSHYYNGSWVALVEDGVSYPLFVHDVGDHSNRRESDWSEAHRQQLYFRGDKYSKDRRGNIHSERMEISVLDPRLILESPDVGFVKVGGVVRWTAIRPVRQRLKGLSSNKIPQVQVNHRQGELMYDLFNPSFEGLINRYLYIAPNTGFIYYKGARVGNIDHGTQTGRLLNIFMYLVELYLQPEFTPYHFVGVERL